MIPAKFASNPTKHFQEVDKTVTFYIGPPPQPVTPTGAIGATLETAMNNFYSSPKKVYTHYNSTVQIKLDLEKKFEICKVLALGGPPPGPPWGPHVPYEHLWTVTLDYKVLALGGPPPGPPPQPVTCPPPFLQEVDEQLLFT